MRFLAVIPVILIISTITINVMRINGLQKELAVSKLDATDLLKKITEIDQASRLSSQIEINELTDRLEERIALLEHEIEDLRFIFPAQRKP